jgi:hypothetical protein
MDIALAVFGAPSKLPLPTYLDSVRSFIQNHRILCCIGETIEKLDEVWSLLENADSRISALENGPRYTSYLVDWIRRGNSEDVAAISSCIIWLPRLVIMQLVQYFSFLAENGLNHAQFVAQTSRLGGIQGFCGGLLAAVAVASTTDEEELKQSISTAIRLAYAIGVYAELGDDSTKPGTTALAVRLRNEGQVDSLIEDLPNASDQC